MLPLLYSGIIKMVIDTMYLENCIDCVLIRIFILAHRQYERTGQL